MKYLLDTNVLISAALFPKGITARAYAKAVTPPNTAIVCDYSMQELKKVFNDKFPDKMETYEIFKERLEKTVDIVPTPPDTEAIKREIKIRDEKDRPILRSAIAAKAGTIITGDKDLLDSGIKRPKMINSAEFINENIKKK